MIVGLILLLFLSGADQATDNSIRDYAIRRAHVWEEPATPLADAKLDRNPDDFPAFGEDQVVDCTFIAAGVAGSTPKFDCQLPNGDVVKVKYGRANPEVYTEVAATRLFAALGFPADRMYVVKGVRCLGCPEDPFPQLECVNNLPHGASIEECLPALDFTRHQMFDDAVIERPLKGRRIESTHTRGWTWEELKFVDPIVGGATRAEIDALRLLAVVVGHWDNKAENQRLICPGQKKDEEECERPLAMVQDLGATFGPLKLDLERWSRMRVWADAASCRVSMHSLPYGGSTFPDAYISEEGRTFLGSRLRRLTAAQIRGLFEGARFARFPHRVASAGSVEAWVRAFQAKVRAIVDRPPCPGDPVPTATQQLRP